MSRTYTIEYSICTDVEELTAFYRPWAKKEFDAHRAVASTFYVARRDGRMVGAAQLIVLPDPVRRREFGLIENVFVDSHYRRQGIASGLMRFIFKAAQEKGCQQVRLTTHQAEGKALYRGLQNDLSYEMRTAMEEMSAFRKVFS